MAVTGHTVMSDSACRASALGASVVASATASATRALLNPPTYVLVYSTADLPAAVAGVITLAANTTYVITTTVDLAGARLVCSANTAIIGGSSENCRIKSTGLGASPLITSAYSLPMRNVSIEATIALALDATGNPDQALDWTGVNFINTPTIGTIRGYGNVVLFAGAFLASAGLTLDGTIGTVALDTYALVVPAGATGITVAAAATITRRMRVQFCSVTVGAGGTGFAVPDLAAFPVAESFILNTVAFSGAGTALSGISQADNTALIADCTGVANSASVASYYMLNNATGTTITVQGTYYKLAGTTTAGGYVRKFTLADNRATYTGAREGYFRVSAIATLTDGNNQDVALRFAIDGVTLPSSTSLSNTGGGGRAQSVGVQDIVFLAPGSYIEVWGTNTTSGGSTLTAVDLNFTINRLD